MLAVVSAVTHFHLYLYGGRVTVLINHSAVKVVLVTPNPRVNMPAGELESVAEG